MHTASNHLSGEAGSDTRKACTWRAASTINFSRASPLAQGIGFDVD
jgi:hypothetical protein